MPTGLFRRGYISFLYRFLQGFTEHDPNRPRKRRRSRNRKPKLRKPKHSSPGSKARLRIRKTPVKTKLNPGSLWQLINGKWTKVQDHIVNVTGPYSKIERCQDFTNPGPPYRSGGTFTNLKVEWAPLQVTGIGQHTSQFTVNLGNGLGAQLTQYRGGFHSPDFSGVDFSDAQYADENFLLGDLSGFVPSLLPYHPLADSNRPSMSHASVGQTLAEISQVPRMMSDSARDFHDYWKFLGGSSSSRRMSPKGIAGSFLNAQFGWVPFVNDVIDVCDLVINYDEILGRKTAKNDRWDHRERVLEVKNEEGIITSGAGQKCLPNAFWLDQMLSTSGGWTKRYQLSTTRKTRVWVSGDYKFYRPEFDMSKSDYDSGLNRIRRVSTLLGTNISPTLLWQITPWSWLVDWFGNVGQMIDHISSAGLDGVVSKNVFLMAHFQRELILTQEFNFHDGPVAFQFIRKVDCKQRGHALTPFQFSLTQRDLTPRQLAILGALGIVRTHA